MRRVTLRHKILEKCFERHDGVLAGGDPANNKLNLEKLKYDSALRDWVVRDLGALAMSFNPEPDFLVGVPNGATWLAKTIGKATGLPTVDLKKDPENRDSFIFANKVERLMCITSERGLIVEDVFSKFTSTRRVLAIPEIGERAMAAIGIWDRQLEGREPLDIPVKAIVNVHMPPMLPENSNLWRFAR